jgi:hypothetical protein
VLLHLRFVFLCLIYLRFVLSPNHGFENRSNQYSVILPAFLADSIYRLVHALARSSHEEVEYFGDIIGE